jgi:nucleoside-diphosphate-sugar epimerase
MRSSMSSTAEPESARLPLVVVLGASGYVGSAVLGALSTMPVRIRAVARSRLRQPALGTTPIELCRADLTEPAALAAAVAGADVLIQLVMHSASWRSAGVDSYGVNVGVLSDLLALLTLRPPSATPPVLLWAGSTSQVGPGAAMPLDGTELDQPESTYDRHKLEAEHMLLQAAAAGVVQGVALRLPTVYGRSRAGRAADRGVVATMIERALAGKPLTVWNGGEVQRDLVHVDDVAAAFIAAMPRAADLTGRHWLIGSGRPTSLVDLFGRIAQLTAAHTGAPAVPVTSVAAPADAAATDLLSVVIDAGPFRRVTRWTPQVSLEEGLATAIGPV